LIQDPSCMVQPQRLKKLLERMVDIYSPSGKEEELVEFLRGYLKRRGLPVTLQPVDENRSNLLVIPPETDVRLALVGHLDTVAAYEIEDYGYSERDGTIRGLGTADMKGGCAAMIEAYLSLWQSGRQRFPAALCLVVGEEEAGDGARQLTRQHHFPWVLIGEPTDLRPCLSHYGYVELHVTTGGQRMHASLAGMAQSAVEVLLNVLLNLSKDIQARHPETTYNIRDLYSVHAGFAVPEYSEAWIDLHLPPSSPLGEIVTELEEGVAEQKGRYPGVDVGVNVTTIDAGYALPEKGRLIDALKTVYDRRGLLWAPEPFRSHSDANQLWAAGMKALILGPGRLEYAHAPQEEVPFDQVALASEIYAELMVESCPGSGG